MRTASVALAYLDDPVALVEAATAVSALTHHDPEAGEACALWCLAIRHALMHGNLDGLREALGHLPPERAAVRAYVWTRRKAAALPASKSNRAFRGALERLGGG